MAVVIFPEKSVRFKNSGKRRLAKDANCALRPSDQILSRVPQPLAERETAATRRFVHPKLAISRPAALRPPVIDGFNELRPRFTV
jgi:hypothetical protein